MSSFLVKLATLVAQGVAAFILAFALDGIGLSLLPEDVEAFLGEAFAIFLLIGGIDRLIRRFRGTVAIPTAALPA